jgi:GTP:adenosylcobinamide-phosphate guanylyltransferase
MMDAIVTAGGIPTPGEPLYEYTQGGSKALLDISGKPMIQWVLDALDGASQIEQVTIIGLPENSGVTGAKINAFIPNQGGLLQNIYGGVKHVLDARPNTNHLLAVSSDIPGITAEMVNWAVNKAEETDLDAYYNVITRQVMEARYPNSRRSYIHFRDVAVCGGDMNVMRAKLVRSSDQLWERIIAARKNALKQAALVGYDTAILLLLRLITLDQAVKMVTRRLKISGQAVLCPYAEIGMDVDKPHQLEIARADLARRVLA